MTLFNDSKAIWWAGTQAVLPEVLISQWFDNSPALPNPCHLLSIGKAACAMAQATLPRLNIVNGLVITKHDHGLPLAGCQVLFADHPIPGHASVQAAEAVDQFIANIHTQPLLLLVSGGASALLGDIPASISLEDWQWLNQTMLANGLNIHQINRCRRALGTLKGGKLLDRLAHVHVTTLAISDVIGDDPAMIGSGLTVPTDANLSQSDVDLLLGSIFTGPTPQQFRLEPLLRQHLMQEVKDNGNGSYQLLGSACQAVARAAMQAEQRGYQLFVQSVPLQHELLTEAQRIVNVLALPVTEPTCYIWWGEPVFSLPENPGKGGRNQHLALCVAQLMPPELSDWHLLAGGTDGTDGPTDAAGGWVDNHTCHKAKLMRVDIETDLARANSYAGLQNLHQLWVTGPTHTNVMDLIIGLKLP
jgi:glycerate 2-kinase